MGTHLTQPAATSSIRQCKKTIQKPFWILSADFPARKIVASIFSLFVGLLALFVHAVMGKLHGRRTEDCGCAVVAAIRYR
jgi:hypothetical protein